MKKLIGHFLREKESGFLWLHTYTFNPKYYVDTPSGRLDLATCEQVDAEVVSAKFFDISGPAIQLLAAKDQNGHYAVFTLFMDSWGFGSIYASITPGFTFKSVYCYNEDLDIYIIGEDMDGNWGIIRVSYLNYIPDPWCWRGGYIPHEIVRFEKKAMQEALGWCRVAAEKAKNNMLIDMTKPTDEIAESAKNGEHWGTTLGEIIRSR